MVGVGKSARAFDHDWCHPVANESHRRGSTSGLLIGISGQVFPLVAKVPDRAGTEVTNRNSYWLAALTLGPLRAQTARNPFAMAAAMWRRADAPAAVGRSG